MDKYNLMMVAASLLFDSVDLSPEHQRVMERRARQKAAKAPKVGTKLKNRNQRKAAKASKRKNLM